MRTPESVYRGERTAAGVRVTVDGHLFLPTRPLPGHHTVSGFEWGYTGAGAQQLAFALVLDATGDRHLAACAHRWLLWGLVNGWGDRWEVTAGTVAKWVAAWRKEARALRLSERYEWAVTLAGRDRAPAPDVVVGPERVAAPAAVTLGALPVGRTRLIPAPPAPDGLEGGGV